MNWETIWRRSRLFAGLERVDGWLTRQVRASWTYRWLTAEPDRRVVVIDLGETATIGSLVALGTWLTDAFGVPDRPRRRSSRRTARILDRATLTAAIETSKTMELVRRLRGLLRNRTD